MELIHERAITLRDDRGIVYDRAHIYGEPQDDGRWAGVIEFVSVDGARTVRTDRETTQRHAAALAYWATGLETVYFEGALDRVLRNAADHTPAEPPIAAPLDRPGLRTAHFEIESEDPTLPLRVMGTRTLVPGQRRRIQDAGVLEYAGAEQASAPGRYAFVVHFGSENAAALVANFLWSTLHTEPAAVIVQGVPIQLTNTALKERLLAAA